MMFKIIAIKSSIVFPLDTHVWTNLYQMKGMDLRITAGDRLLCNHCIISTDPVKGLAGKEHFPLETLDGMFFNSAAPINGVDMSFPIDVIYLNGRYQITTLFSSFKPNSTDIYPVDYVDPKAAKANHYEDEDNNKDPLTQSAVAIELPDGTIKMLGLNLEDQLSLSVILVE
jgi:uncharacterized membrane protein (UPF0127 family)